MSDDNPVFVDYGLGIHNPYYYDLYRDDPIAVDPGLTLSPYSTSPDSPFTSPEPVPLSSPHSYNDFFVADHRDSIGSLDTATTIAPHETVTNTAAAKSCNLNNNKGNSSKPTKTTPSSSPSPPPSTAAAAAAPRPSTNTSPMVTRTRKASSQNADASGSSTAQPRAKRQRTASSAQSITVKLESQEPLPQQRPQRQRQPSPSPPRRKPARRSSAARKEDVAQRTKNLERNRIAASKCRQKKKEWVVELEETKTSMELRHTQLRSEYFQLLDEVTAIKNQLMTHARCNDPHINFWIEKEALKYVERCMDTPPDRRPSAAGNATSGSGTLPSPAESHRSQQESPLLKAEGGINLDYMPDELLTGDFP
ncbi:hypothetical protein ACQKWADRAFT_300353 [Trichoderma austrokoningii]